MGVVSIEEDIKYLADKFNNLVRNTKMTKAKHKQFFLDYLYILFLIEISGLEDKIELENIPTYDFLDTYLPARFERNIHEISEVCKPAVDTFVDAGFFTVNIPSKKCLSYEEASDIILDFIDYMVPKSMPFFEDLNRKGDFKVAPKLLEAFSADGLSFMMPNIDEYRLFIESEKLRTVPLINALIHEFIHLYCAKVLADKPKALYNYKHGYFLEAPTILSEMLLYEFLRVNGYEKDAILVRNNTDCVSMRSLRDIVYLDEMVKRGNQVDFRNDPIKVTGGDTRCDLYRGIKGIEFPENKSKVDNCYLEYCLSSLEAYSLLEQIKSGEKPEKVLECFLRRMRYEEGYKGTLGEDYNYGFIKTEIEDEMKVLKKHYSRYKGYKEARR